MLNGSVTDNDTPFRSKHYAMETQTTGGRHHTAICSTEVKVRTRGGKTILLELSRLAVSKFPSVTGNPSYHYGATLNAFHRYMRFACRLDNPTPRFGYLDPVT
ncbi:hypothetical protein J6590_033569 [Homalodisca vitripennis]|nr:hypothetical protein J6590_033569 [Homalodisca vitripennis]